MSSTIMLTKKVGKKVMAFYVPLGLMPEAGGSVEITVRGTAQPYKVIKKRKLGGAQ